MHQDKILKNEQHRIVWIYLNITHQNDVRKISIPFSSSHFQYSAFFSTCIWQPMIPTISFTNQLRQLKQQQGKKNLHWVIHTLPMGIYHMKPVLSSITIREATKSLPLHSSATGRLTLFFSFASTLHLVYMYFLFQINKGLPHFLIWIHS